ncbi:MAG TPA: hypothetical protein VK171_11400 [Fimbriimonas sp.]|nr:hypothetical protein [Fimbriimonas sp.]
MNSNYPRSVRTSKTNPDYRWWHIAVAGAVAILGGFFAYGGDLAGPPLRALNLQVSDASLDIIRVPAVLMLLVILGGCSTLIGRIKFKIGAFAVLFFTGLGSSLATTPRGCIRTSLEFAIPQLAAIGSVGLALTWGLAAAVRFAVTSCWEPSAGVGQHQ